MILKPHFLKNALFQTANPNPPKIHFFEIEGWTELFRSRKPKVSENYKHHRQQVN